MIGSPLELNNLSYVIVELLLDSIRRSITGGLRILLPDVYIAQGFTPTTKRRDSILLA